jgi:hypothetical protein
MAGGNADLIRPTYDECSRVVRLELFADRKRAIESVPSTRGATP